MLPIRLSILVCTMLLVLPAAADDQKPKGNTQARVLPIKGDRIVCDKPLQFKTRTAELLPESRVVLASVAATLETHLDLAVVEVGVHTDSRGSGAYNKRMTQERADSVRLSLIKMGVKAARLKAVGYGEERPVASNRTAEGRASNRRVEFIIKTRKKAQAP